MTDFEIDHLPFSKNPLPFGMELSGNLGVRVVKTNVMGTGNMSFTTIKKTASYDPLNPNAAGGTTTTTFRKNTSIQDDATDVMPIYNLALWAIPNTLVVRYNHAKTVARPGMSRLLPSTGCTYDERTADLPVDPDGSESDQRCGGVMGNPGIKPYTNTNKNLAVEWYANKDTMFSMAAFKQVGIIGAPNKVVPRTGVKVFAGSDAVDPVTGTKLSDLEFAFNQYDNLEPSIRRGVEFATKTAFTFLPSVLRYTGLDANYTRVRSDSALPSVDLLTGDVLPPVGEPKYSYNASLWYDDGRFSARVALQVVAPRYQCFAPCTTSNIGVNNFPADGATSIRAPYNPGLPLFSDATRFVDVKMAYKFKNNMEVFVEGRNVTNQRTHSSTGGYEDYSGGVPYLYSDNFNGRRIMVGLNIRSAQ
jgi:TonB-dependent receptor